MLLRNRQLSFELGVQYFHRLQNTLASLKQFLETNSGSSVTTPGKTRFDLDKLADEDGNLTPTTTVVTETIIGASASTHDQDVWEDDKDVNSEINSEPHTQLITTLDTLVRPQTFDYRPIAHSAILTTSQTIQSAWGTPNQRNYLFSNASNSAITVVSSTVGGLSTLSDTFTTVKTKDDQVCDR